MVIRGPGHFQTLKDEDEERRKAYAPPPETKHDIALRRMEEFERQSASAQAERDQQKRDGLISGNEAFHEAVKTENDLGMAHAALQAADAKRQANFDNINRLAEEHVGILAKQAADMASVRARFDATGEEVTKRSEFDPDGNRFGHERQRHQEALRQQFGGDKPFEAEQRATGTEYSLFVKEQERFEKLISNEADLTTRNDLTIQKNIRAADYVAYTAERIADQNETLTGGGESETSEKYRQRAEEYQKASDDLRQDYKDRGARTAWSHSDTASGDGMGSDVETRFAAFERETSSTQPAQARTTGRGGLD